MSWQLTTQSGFPAMPRYHTEVGNSSAKNPTFSSEGLNRTDSSPAIRLRKPSVTNPSSLRLRLESGRSSLTLVEIAGTLGLGFPKSRYLLLHPESRSASEASCPHRSPITPRTLVGGSYQGPPPQGSPDDVLQATQIKQHVNDLQLKERLTGNVDHMINDNRRANTEIACGPKKQEYMAYCDVVYANDPYKYILSETKVLCFMYYVAYREQKKKGRRKKLEPKVIFDYANYQAVMAQKMPDPQRPIGGSQFNTYRTVLKNMLLEQQAKFLDAGLTKAWEFVWMANLRKIEKHVWGRAAQVRRQNNDEKIPSSFEPYMVVEKYGEIEEELWKCRGSKSGCSPRSVHTQLRHRYCMLHLTSGMLRAESIYNAEWSNFVGIKPPKRKGKDIHQVFIMVNVIPEGKTNSSKPIYGRAIRHRKVKLCCIGALSFYFMYRIHHTKEFATMTVDMWARNETWFSINVLTGIQSDDNTSGIQNDLYTRCIGEISTMLGIPINKYLHLGRNVRSRTLDFLEADEGEIRRMGQWNLSTFDNHYSSKIPMKAMRMLAGYENETDLYFNTQTSVQPSDDLLRATPIGCWVYDTLREFQAEHCPTRHPTATRVC